MIAFTSARVLGYWDGEQHEIGRCNCYGLTWNKHDIFYSFNEAKTSVIASLQSGPCGFEGLDNVHQILWHDGKLYVTNTSQDRVAWWDGEGFGEIVFKEQRSDGLHINSLWCQGKTLLVLESGLGRGIPPIVRFLEDDVIINSTELPQGHLLHNIYIENGVLYGCYKTAEPVSGVYRMELSSGEFRKKPMGRDVFMCGLARSKNYFYFGRSESKPREERTTGDSSILIMDSDLNEIDVIELKDTGMLRDVRLTEEADFAHNGIVLKKWTSLLSLQQTINGSCIHSAPC